MPADADLSQLATAMTGHRSAILLSLLGGSALSASEIARQVNISASLASNHLGKLRDAGLITVHPEGRRRRYRLAGPEVADLLEHMLTLAPARPAGSSLREHTRAAALSRARTCYDHLAGRLGVAVTDAMAEAGMIAHESLAFHLRPDGEEWLTDLGVDTDALHRARRALTRPCLDWTERRPHLAGAVGAAIAASFLDRSWVARIGGTRAVLVTPAGRSALQDILGLALDD